MGNIGSEVGRAFAARRRGDTTAMTGAWQRGLDLLDATARATCSPKIAKAPRSPARPRTIRWHGGRIVRGLLYVVCYSGAEGAIIKAPRQYLAL